MERWTDQKLDKLADAVERLADQMQQMHRQIGHLGNRVEQTCTSADSLVAVISTQPMPLETTYLADASDVPPTDWLDRLATLEQQVLQLTEQVKHLERRAAANLNPSITLAGPTAPFVDDDVDDEPDEILWDFIEPTSDK